MKESNKKERKRLFMEVNGIVKEIDMEKLSDNVVFALEEAYDRSKIVGISRSLYIYMAEFLAEETTEYSLAVSGVSGDTVKSKIFANKFEINSKETPCLLESLFWIETNALINPSFTSRDINMKNVRAYLALTMNGKCSYAKMAKEFKDWSKNPFKYSDMMIGFIRFLKYFYSLIKCDMQPALVAC